MPALSIATKIFALSLLYLSLGVLETAAQDFSGDTINAVRTNMNTSSTQSWEMGTATEALLEYDHSQFSVFSSSPPFTPSGSLTPSSIQDVLYFARKALSQRNGSTTIIADQAAGDPASLGVAVILGDLADADTGVPNLSYVQAAQQEIDFLLNQVPRNSDGAISHRVDEVSLWSDFIYMVPPFLAYYGVYTNNQTLVNEAVNQISLYRQNLFVPSVQLWRHVVLGSFQDTGLWSTGNAWAAAGMVRVLATIQNSHFSGNFKDQKNNLVSWATEIHTGFYNSVDTNTNLNHDYLNDTGTFLEAAGSTLMAASVLRLATLSGKYQFLPKALAYRSSLVTGNLNSKGGPSISSDGWLQPVVNPENFVEEGSRSPESESFVLLMEAAYRDWKNAGSKGANTASRSAGSALGSGALGLLGAILVGGALSLF